MNNVLLSQIYRGVPLSSALKAADAKARRNFIYTSEQGDKWRSFAVEALEGRSWRGDCDDLTSTAADIAIRMGIKKEQLWFAVVATGQSGAGKADHLVALAKDEKGKWWVIGDTFGAMYPLASMKHELLEVHNLAWPIKDWEYMTKQKMLSR